MIEEVLVDITFTTTNFLFKDLSLFQNIKFHYYQGAYDFVAEDRSELGFRKGEILKIINSNDVDWWKGTKIEYIDSLR